MIHLRDYQQEAVHEVFERLREVRSTLIVLPTGTGKTVTFATVARDWPTGRVLVIAHREELIFQAKEKISAITGESPAIEMADSSADEADGWIDRARIVIASVQSLNAGPRCKVCMCPACGGTGRILLTNISSEEVGQEPCEPCGGQGRKPGCRYCIGGRVLRILKFKPKEFGLIVVDEAHHSTAESYRRVLDYFGQNPSLKVLGVTATPDRHDEEALGQIFHEVAYNLEIQEVIEGGYLVGIDQQYVLVEDLDFSRCRTTACDLNSADLEQAMMVEKVLHGVVTPTIELAGEAPTLIFAASVAHAERIAEIINRHRPGAAYCLHGKTPPEQRREVLWRYRHGEFQFLVNCGLFLEGFDETRIACVSIARPTKSRVLYAQMVGRGTRPLPGLIDEDWMEADDRKEAIAQSAKPRLLVLDFVGNSGRHKLISTADILGGKYPDAVIERAARCARKKSEAGVATDMLAELKEAQKQAEEEQRQQRKALVARARYTPVAVSPFDVFDIRPQREPGWHKGRLPTPRQIEVLKKNGVETAGLSFWQVRKLIESIVDRQRKGLCTYRQAKLLARYGYDPDISFVEARRIIDGLVANGWRRLPQSVKV